MHGFDHVTALKQLGADIIKNTISFLPNGIMISENELISILDVVDSSNNYAMAQAHAGLAKHGQAWFAKEQTAGKGQRGKKWETAKGENITLSIAVVPAGLKPSEQFPLSVAVTLGCFDFFYGIAGNETFIKWPNDIYWRDRKAGGILIENIVQGNDWKYAIIGIGINVNQVAFPAELPNPISLSQITGKKYDVIALAKILRLMVMKRIEARQEMLFPMMLQEYNLHLYKLHSPVKLKKKEIVFETEIVGVNNDGKLMTRGIKDNEFDFSEIEWITE